MQDFKSILYKIIGDRIKSKRKELGLSQDDLSKHLNLGRSSISNIEIGRHQIPLSVLYELSILLKINVHNLLPTYEEVVELLNSKIKEYSKILEAKDLNSLQRESVEDILKNIGNYDN